MFGASQLPGHVVGLFLETPGPAVRLLGLIGVPTGFHPAQDALLIDDQKLMGDVNLDTRPGHLETEPRIEQRSRMKLGGEVAGPLVDERLHGCREEDLGPQPRLEAIPAGGPVSGLLPRVWTCRPWPAPAAGAGQRRGRRS